MRILDLGGGTGELAVPLAELGPLVTGSLTVIDPSPDALAALARRATESGVSDRVVGVQGDGDTLDALSHGQTYDLVCCHGVLEVVDDPSATMAALAAALAPQGRLSLLVAGRLAAVVARALAGEFAHAQALLEGTDGRWGSGDPLPRRFDVPQLQDLAAAAGLVVALRVAGAEAVVLGCTEMPVAFPERAVDGLPLIDPTWVLARALIRIAAPNQLKEATTDFTDYTDSSDQTL